MDISADEQVVVAWTSGGQKGSGTGIFTRVLAEDLSFSTGEIQVNTITTGDQNNPDVAWLENGGFVIAWESPDGASTGVTAQAFTAENLKDGGEFAINTTLVGAQSSPRIASMPDGGFLAVWQDSALDGSGSGVVARAFDLDHTGGAEFIVPQIVAGDQSDPDVARLSGPDIVVTWQSPGVSGDVDVFQRRIDIDTLAPLGSDVKMNAHLPGNQSRPSIGALSDGDFVVVWDGEGPFADTLGIYGRWYDATPPMVIGAQTTSSEGLITSLLIQFSEPVGVSTASLSVVGQSTGPHVFTGE